MNNEYDNKKFYDEYQTDAIYKLPILILCSSYLFYKFYLRFLSGITSQVCRAEQIRMIEN